jgi:CRP/FNR family transcriptional regulator
MKQNSNTLSFLRPDLADKIIGLSSIEEFPQGTEILKENQYIKTLPILIDGLIKVYAKFDDKELLLYYIEKSQSCIMTFYASLKNTPSKVTAVTEEDSRAILLPISHLPDLIKDFPEFNELFYNQFNLKYIELIERLGHLLLDNMDKILFNHFKKK